MQCLRCQGTRHVPRECKVPRYSRCRRFGHVETDCVRTYASAIGTAKSEVVAEHVMDVAETEDALKEPAAQWSLRQPRGRCRQRPIRGGEEPQHLMAPVITKSVAEPEQAAKEVMPVEVDEAAATQVEVDEAAATQGETSGSGDEMSVTSATLKRSHDKTREAGEDVVY
ncbi:hypothetical protein HPB50_017125 [Hyalomma asiaticum]|uniref:Uncharacterized protein n=1 Tax=Hyalomma asiaticum TaxID=266040 RepID=A0ACB7TJX5_HYAAI|nr:hypothetical protein HPB50_017125 [Hyalomma asiaticum]